MSSRILPCLILSACAGAWAADAAAPDPLDRARALHAEGKHAEALREAEARLAAAPADDQAKQLVLSIRVAQLEGEIRGLLQQQVESRNLIVGAPDYEAAKARSDKSVALRLDIVEYHLAREDWPRAVEGCNAILKDHPNEQATLCLKFRILNRMVDRERRALELDQGYRRKEGINDVVAAATFPREQAAIPRTVLIFDEDLAEGERAAVRAKLQEKVTLMQDGATVGDTLRQLFAVAGINYMILDSAIGAQTISLHLIDEKVEIVLANVARMAKVRYHYNNGTVSVVGEDTEVLVTEIIRLQSGLTDTEAKPNIAPLTDESNGSGNGGSQQPPPQPNPVANLLGQDQNQQPQSDLERFLAKVPDIIVGWPADGRIYLEKKSNTLYVRSSPWAIAELKRLLHALDYNNVQVLIETRFVEVGENALRNLGVQWGVSEAGTAANNASYRGGFIPSAATAIPSSGLVASILTAKESLGLDARLAALQEDSKADTLAEPKILTLNNTLGQIDLRQDVPYVSDYESRQQSNQSVNSTNNTTQYVTTTVLVPKFSTANQGFQLKIKPSIARNHDVITLSVQPTVRQLDGFETSQFNYDSGATAATEALTGTIRKPIFKTRQLATALHVGNGETVVMGGLITENDQVKSSGVPVMQDVPLIGALFRSRLTTTDRRHLLIMVKATIIDPSGAKLGDEIRQLRDTVQVTLPADARAAQEARDAVPAAAATETAPDGEAAGAPTRTAGGTVIRTGTTGRK